MSNQSSVEKRDSHSLRRGRLGAIAIAFVVVSASAPLTAMAGGAPVAMVLGNGAGLPLAYVVVSLMLLLFSVGYTTMSRHHTSTGGFYAMVAQGLKQYLGGAAAWVALLGYNAMQIGLYGLFGAASAAFFKDTFHFELPWYAYALVAGGVIAFLGFRNVDVSVRVLGVLVALEFLMVLILDFAILFRGGNHASHAPITMEPFSIAAFLSGSVAIALLFNTASFVGFESTTIYSEEAKNPHVTVPRATYIAVLTIGIFYTFTTWLMVNADTPTSVVAHVGSLKPDPTAYLFELSAQYLGTIPTQLMSFLFATSVFAALLAFHNAVARYLYALGREGIVPEQLGRTHKVHLSPHIGSLSQSALAFIIVMLFVLLKLDPVLNLFTWLTQLGTLAVLYLMMIASAAVVGYFLVHRNKDKNIVTTLLAPGVSAVIMAVVAVFATTQFGNLIGDPQSPLGWFLPLLILIAAILGAVAAIVLRRVAPELFDIMGRHRGEELVADVDLIPQ